MVLTSQQYQAMLVFVFILQLSGILFYKEGFFLTRVELPERSVCEDIPKWRNDGVPSDRACWTKEHHTFKRAIVIVIDALRYDFAAWDDSLTHERFFENKLVAIRDALISKPLNSLLVPFYADPPTTTMQRLKGIVTGGLPTFLEIKDDVAAKEITEDNFIDLLAHSGRNLTFMGDDTWTALFPTQFHRSFPFPSFNVKDLDTVDRGVEEHLLPEIRRDDWDIVIGHFLGVDHCGHRYGSENSEMSRKLGEMNMAVDSVIREMELGSYDDTVLLVFGDHGMTADGNHGGALDEEVGAALFVYSTKPLLLGGKDVFDAKVGNYEKLREDFTVELDLLHPGNRHQSGDRHWPLGRRPNVDQIDLAPTLALLLGLPIPYGNLGTIIPELFFRSDAPSDEESEWVERYRVLNDAMELNAGQVLRYLREYAARTRKQVSDYLVNELNETAISLFKNLSRYEEMFKKNEISSMELRRMHHHVYTTLKKLLAKASSLGRDLWTEFNMLYISIGIVLMGFGTAILLVSLYFHMKRCLAFGYKEFRNEAASVLLAIFLLLARLSNSYIVTECRVNAFVTTSLVISKLLVSYKRKDKMCLLVVGLGSRLSVDLAPTQWWRGQEAVYGDVTTLWFWTWCLVPLLIGAILIILNAGASRFGLLLLLQTCCTWLHWLLQASGVEITKHALVRIVYLLTLVIIGSSLSNHFKGEMTPRQMLGQLALSLLLPLILVTGPASPLVILITSIQLACVYFAYHKCGLSLITSSILWLMIANNVFYATGHETFFNKLHYLSPFVGFDEHHYHRGILMMGFNTFGMYIVMVLLLATFGHLNISPNLNVRILQLALLCFQSLLSLTTFVFVAIQRRHLMVWAIFAPKFVFDAFTILIVQATSIVASLILNV